MKLRKQKSANYKSPKMKPKNIRRPRLKSVQNSILHYVYCTNTYISLLNKKYLAKKEMIYNLKTNEFHQIEKKNVIIAQT